MIRTARTSLFVAAALSACCVVAGCGGGDLAENSDATAGVGTDHPAGNSTGAGMGEGADWRTSYEAFLKYVEGQVLIRPKQLPGARIKGKDFASGKAYFAVGQPVAWTGTFNGLDMSVPYQKGYGAVEFAFPPPPAQVSVRFHPLMEQLPLWQIVPKGTTLRFTAEMKEGPRTSVVAMQEARQVDVSGSLGFHFYVSIDASSLGDSPPPGLDEAVKNSKLIAEAVAGKQLSEDEIVRLVACLCGHRELDSLIMTRLNELGPSAASAVPELTRHLQAGRGDMLNALGRIGPGARSAIPEILAILTPETQPGRVRLALETLKAIGPDPAQRDQAARLGVRYALTMKDPRHTFKKDAEPIVLAARDIDAAAAASEGTALLKQEDLLVAERALTAAAWIGPDMAPALRRIVRGNSIRISCRERAWTVDGAKRMLYWADGSKILRAPLSEVRPEGEMFAKAAGTVACLALDSTKRRLYWLEHRGKTESKLCGIGLDDRKAFDVVSLPGAQILAVDGRTDEAAVLTKGVTIVSLRDGRCRAVDARIRQTATDGRVIEHGLHEGFRVTGIALDGPNRTWYVSLEEGSVFSNDLNEAAPLKVHLVLDNRDRRNVPAIAYDVQRKELVTRSPATHAVVASELNAVFWWDPFMKAIYFAIAGEHKYPCRFRVSAAEMLNEMGVAKQAVEELLLMYSEPFAEPRDLRESRDKLKPILAKLAADDPRVQSALDAQDSEMIRKQPARRP